MFSNKEWLEIPFRSEDVRAATLEETHLTEGKRDCFQGGWAEYMVPSFKNQGQCVKYFDGLRNDRMKELRARHK